MLRGFGWLGALRGLLADRSGNAAVLFGLTLLPLMASRGSRAA